MKKNNDLVDFVNFSLSNFPKELVTLKNISQIKEVASLFLGEIQKPIVYVLEVHLTDSIPKVDFFINLTAFREHPNFIGIPNSKIFHSIYPLYTSWQNSFSIGGYYISSFWFEFDISDLSNNQSESSIYISSMIPFNNQCEPKKLTDFINKTDLFTINKSILVYRTFNFISSLPDKAYISYVGFMQSRTPNFIRFVISNISSVDFIQYLKKIKWKWNDRSLKGFLTSLSNIFDEFAFTIDFDTELNIKSCIGIECYYNKRDFPNQEKRWADALKLLNDLGICSGYKANSILKFGNQKGMDNSITTNLNHLKVVYDNDKLISSKVYYFFSVNPNIK